MAAPPKSRLDGNQVLQHAFEDATGELRVQATLNPIGGTEVEIDHTNDSIALGDGTNLLTSTTVGADIGLDVNLINSSLNIRPLVDSTDSVSIGDGSNTLAINSDGSIDAKLEFDTDGSTDHFNGTATTTPANIPSSAGNIITSVMIKNTNSSNIDLQVSFDGGTTYYNVERGEILTGEPKGNLTQFIVKTASSTATYQSIVNRKA